MTSFIVASGMWHWFFMLLGFLNVSECQARDVQERWFTIDFDNDTFIKDGEPFRIVSGSIHYFRVHPDDWTDRLLKLKYAGFNTVQTYIEWSSHEPRPGTYDFTSFLNVTDFIRKANNVGLLVIIRPGPFIDAERDMGGLPSWLIEKNPYVQLRTNDPMYMGYVERWFAVLLQQLNHLQYSKEGPIIMMQVENEYGSYPACDFFYTSALRDIISKYMGPGMLLYTTDGYLTTMLRCGRVAETYTTVDFGPGSGNGPFQAQRLFEPHGPLLNSEYYTGWLDHWGYPHSKRSTESVTSSLEDMLAMNASVNMYMAHGGTSFGLKSGSNLFGDAKSPNFQACPTSYDYDAPISEAGDLTHKYWAIRDVIGKYHPLPDMTAPTNSSKAAYGTVEVMVERNLFEVAKNWTSVESTDPTSFEKLKYDNGLVIYELTLQHNTTDPSLLSVGAINDRAYVYLDQRFQGILDRQQKITQLPLTARQGQLLTLVVESMGRVCFGPNIRDSKGLVGPVKIGSKTLTGWKQTPVHLKPGDGQSILGNTLVATDKGAMTWYAGSYNVTTPKDTFLRLDGWHKVLQRYLCRHTRY